MSEIADRYRRVAGRFTERVSEVPDGAWENPAPCEGWVARDVVRHLVEWMPAFSRPAAGLDAARRPVGRRRPGRRVGGAERRASRRCSTTRTRRRSGVRPPAGRHAPLEDAIDMFFLGDVLVHTWDLARATGLDETLDADEVHRMFVGMEPMDEVLR